MTTSHRVFGLPLVELQLGHWFLLERIGSPIATYGTVSLDDARAATLVCAAPWRDSNSNLRSRWLSIGIAFWNWRTRKLNPDDECGKFSAYLDEQLACPKIISEGYSTANSPWHWRLLVFLMSDMNMTEPAALAMTVVRANALWAANLERTGAAKVAWGYRNQDFADAVRVLERDKAQSVATN